MFSIGFPTDIPLIQALGQLAIAHTHLELVLRYTVRTLTDLTIIEALDATHGERTSDTRKRIRKLFLEKKPTAEEMSKFDSLMGAAQRLSEERNNYLHSAWSQTNEGQALIKTEKHLWQTAPSVEDINKTTTDILALVQKIGHARLEGFIFTVVERETSPSIPA